MTDHPVRLPSEPAIEAAARIRWERTESDSSPTKQWADAPTWIQKAFRETAAIELEAAYAVDGAVLRVPAPSEPNDAMKVLTDYWEYQQQRPLIPGANELNMHAARLAQALVTVLRVPAQEAPRPFDMMDALKTALNHCDKCGRSDADGAAPRAVEGAALESAIERFERIANEFYEDTGFLAPGKDVPLAIAHGSHDMERHAAWKIWNAGRSRSALSRREPQ